MLLGGFSFSSCRTTLQENQDQIRQSRFSLLFEKLFPVIAFETVMKTLESSQENNDKLHLFRKSLNHFIHRVEGQRNQNSSSHFS